MMSKPLGAAWCGPTSPPPQPMPRFFKHSKHPPHILYKISKFLKMRCVDF